jgi:hypothetical protein
MYREVGLPVSGAKGSYLSNNDFKCIKHPVSPTAKKSIVDGGPSEA